MDCVVDKDDVLIAVHKIHHWLGGVAKTQKKISLWVQKIYHILYFLDIFTLVQYILGKVPVTHLRHACTSVSRAKSRSVSNLWCIGDHLNSGMRNMVVRGPGLNCLRCSSVMGMPLKPRSTRRSRSSCAAVRPWRACGNGRWFLYRKSFTSQPDTETHMDERHTWVVAVVWIFLASLSFPSSDLSVSEVVLAVSPPVLFAAASTVPDVPSTSGKSGLDTPWIWLRFSVSAKELMSARWLWILKGPSSGRSPGVWPWVCVKSEPQLVMWARRLRSSLAQVEEWLMAGPEGVGWSGLGSTRGSVAARAGRSFSSTLKDGIKSKKC